MIRPVSTCKTIILTDEQKKLYEFTAALRTPRKLRKKRKRCKCLRRYGVEHALRCGHPGFCSMACADGVRRKPKIKIRPKVQVKQIRRNEKKVAAPDFYSSDAWRDLRYKVLRSLGFACLACGRRPPAVVLHVDHIKPRFKYPELELDQNNLQVLCADCNVGKRHYYEDDLRPKQGDFK